MGEVQGESGGLRIVIKKSLEVAQADRIMTNKATRAENIRLYDFNYNLIQHHYRYYSRHTLAYIASYLVQVHHLLKGQTQIPYGIHYG